MALESPLFLTKVECPICGTINEFETIRVGAYSEGERETDFCPSFIKWRNPKYQKYHPLLFFTATCSHCFYTREFNTKFKEWGKDNNFRAYRQKAIKERHLNELAAADSFVKLVGGLLNNEEYPDETAVLKLLLAIYDEILYDHPSHLDLGRFYLRVAWLFRQRSGGGGTESRGARSGPLSDVERGVTDLQTWQAGMTRNIEYLKSAVAAYSERTRESECEDSSELQTFDQTISKLEEIDGHCRRVLSELEALVLMSKTPPGETILTGNAQPFYNHPSFDEFLVRLMRMWDGVPRNEAEAMRFAVRYYIQAYEAGKEIASGNQTIQAAYLIAELSRRIGDHDTARQYFNTTIKTGQEFMNEIRGDRTRTVFTRKMLELALAQGKKNLAEAKKL